MIKDNLCKVLSQIKAAAQSCGRDISEIRLICASKYADAGRIREAFGVGIKAFGENKVQDARKKQQELKDLAIEWHMIGHLQGNKAKDAVKMFSLIHSLDSLHLAQEIGKQAHEIAKIQDVLIEVNTTEEEQKFGINVAQTLELIKVILPFKNISVKGLMTMGKFTDNPQENRIYFKKLKGLLDAINRYLSSKGLPLLSILSMGMTDDFQTAIEEGSTMVRVGRAIWGKV